MISPTVLSNNAIEQTWNAIVSGARTMLVDSPPGAGKSTLVREISRRLSSENQVPIVVQTNNQADDMVKGFAGSGILIGRLHSSKYVPDEEIALQENVICSSSIKDLEQCNVIVSPAAKWKFVDNYSWPIAIIDEAYQMRSDALLPIGAMMDRLLLVGDPGQLDPFTIADDSIYRGRTLTPVETAAATILETQPETVRIALPVSWRLPASAASIISNAFYNKEFISGTAASHRVLEKKVTAISKSRSTRAVDKAIEAGWAYVELEDIVLPDRDEEIIGTICELVNELLSAGIVINDEKGCRDLTFTDIAVGVTHRDQRDHLKQAISSRLSPLWGSDVDFVTIDTANRIQGREFEIVVVWHPLSGRRDASTFHLDAGRLCVLLSRHRQACIVVSRGGIAEQLSAYPSVDPVWLGESTVPKDGWHAHLKVLDHLEAFKLQRDE